MGVLPRCCAHAIATFFSLPRPLLKPTQVSRGRFGSWSQPRGGVVESVQALGAKETAQGADAELDRASLSEIVGFYEANALGQALFHTQTNSHEAPKRSLGRCP
jgi:hypothetical protein